MKIIFRYLKGTIDLGLWYLGKNSFSLKSYLDANWEGFVDDRKVQVRSIILRIIIGSLEKQEAHLNLSVYY